MNKLVLVLTVMFGIFISIGDNFGISFNDNLHSGHYRHYSHHRYYRQAPRNIQRVVIMPIPKKKERVVIMRSPGRVQYHRKSRYGF